MLDRLAISHTDDSLSVVLSSASSQHVRAKDTYLTSDALAVVVDRASFPAILLLLDLDVSSLVITRVAEPDVDVQGLPKREERRHVCVCLSRAPTACARARA